MPKKSEKPKNREELLRELQVETRRSAMGAIFLLQAAAGGAG